MPALDQIEPAAGRPRLVVCQEKQTKYRVAITCRTTYNLKFDQFQEEILFNPLTTPRPCVGLCHYYKSLGMDNPYEKRDQAKFTP